MFDKTKIFNLALAALSLQKRISNADTDSSTEALTLNVYWDLAFNSALQEMDLDSTSTSKALELVEENPNEYWSKAYLYPTDCVLLRRIKTGNLTDDEESKEDLRVEIYEGQKVIMTNKDAAEIEYISKDVPFSTLTAEAAHFISLRLAKLAIPLVAGTNKKDVLATLNEAYSMALLDAQRKDRIESSIYQPEYAKSALVKARLS